MVLQALKFCMNLKIPAHSNLWHNDFGNTPNLRQIFNESFMVLQSLKFLWTWNWRRKELCPFITCYKRLQHNLISSDVKDFLFKYNKCNLFAILKLIFHMSSSSSQLINAGRQHAALMSEQAITSHKCPGFCPWQSLIVFHQNY